MAEVHDDGLALDTVNPYAEEKHRFLAHYAEMFAKGMQNRFDHRIYLDLFSSSGYAKIKGTERIIQTSPILALSLPVPFTRYVFCDLSEEKISALRKRVERSHPSCDAHYYVGDVNQTISTVLAELPDFKAGNTGLSLCFIDPYAAKNLRYETMKSLSKIYVDLFVMIPSYIDLNRHQTAQCEQEEMKSSFDLMVGTSEWRAEWEEVRLRRTGLHFGEFCVEYFGRRMETLGYLPLDPSDIILIDDEVWFNAPRYHITLFSRHAKGIEFWRKTRKHLIKQLSLF